MTEGRPSQPGASLIGAFDAVLSDLDGVVYAGPEAIPGAVPALLALVPAGVGLGYITNNASRTPEQVAAHLRELGAPATAEQVTGSAQAGAALLAERLPAGSKVLVIGGAALRTEVESRGFNSVASAEDLPDAVIQGFDPALGWRELAEAAFAIHAGALWIATNTDLTIPVARGIAPGNGSLVAAVRNAVGIEPLVAGKPQPAMFRLAAASLDAQRPLVVGDRLDTDILGGNNAGMATAAVLTGIDNVMTILSARTAERPDYLIADLAGLHTAYPQIERNAKGTRCGAATAVLRDGRIEISGDSNDVDSWRAACALWWDAVPEVEESKTPEIDWT